VQFEIVWLEGKRAVEHLSGLRVAMLLAIDDCQLTLAPNVSGVERSGCLQVAGSLIPPSLPSLQATSEEDGVRVIRQRTTGDRQLRERRIEVALSPVVEKGAREMHFAGIGLQAGGCVDRFFRQRKALWRLIIRDPVVAKMHPGEQGERSDKRRILRHCLIEQSHRLVARFTCRAGCAPHSLRAQVRSYAATFCVGLASIAAFSVGESRA
jgi:hypothetical protein